MKKSNAWRKTVLTEEILAKLEEWFLMSLTDEECCLFAWINPSTLYRYIEKNPEFSERKELLKKQPNIKAKINWKDKINSWDYHASKEWLERKSKSEFSLKQEIQQENTNLDVSEWLTEEQKKMMAERFMKVENTKK